MRRIAGCTSRPRGRSSFLRARRDIRNSPRPVARCTARANRGSRSVCRSICRLAGTGARNRAVRRGRASARLRRRCSPQSPSARWGALCPAARTAAAAGSPRGPAPRAAERASPPDRGRRCCKRSACPAYRERGRRATVSPSRPAYNAAAAPPSVQMFPVRDTWSEDRAPSPPPDFRSRFRAGCPRSSLSVFRSAKEAPRLWQSRRRRR